jgi:type II secretory ATPase GspE/PulE/Tfp pilus assembly ATPase PilB-like protein
MLKSATDGTQATPNEVDLAHAASVARGQRIPLVVRVVSRILSDAVRAGASEIFVEPRAGELFVRFLIDGAIVDSIRLPQHLQTPIISRLKILGGMGIAVRDAPQHGRVILRSEGARIEMLITATPSAFGEHIHMRLPSRGPATAAFESVGMTPRTLDAFRRVLANAHGMIVIAGPPASGRTTTIEAACRHLAALGRPPVVLGGGAAVPRARLRALLREVDDVVALDGLSDHETMAMAMETAQNGRLVLASLEAVDAAAAVRVLLDLGVEPYQISLSVPGILAQRLVRRVCPSCGVKRAPSIDVIHQLGLPTDVGLAGGWRAGEGCVECQATGYLGHVAIHELLDLNEEIRSLVSAHAPDHLIRDTARRYGMTSILDDGVAKALAGQTTLDEVQRVAPVVDGGAMVSLPRSGGSTDSSTSSDAGVQAHTRKTILIIDDDREMQALLRLVLDAAGYRTVVACDGVEALLALGRAPADLILCDIEMPYLNGTALMELTSQKGIHAPVIVLTASTGEAIEEQCFSLGAVDFIRKPLNRDVLLFRVRRALA